LKLLAIKGCIVTIDAMGCQTHIAKQIIDQEGAAMVTVTPGSTLSELSTTRPLMAPVVAPTV
jgi:predicted transposase YbfD/YdcC